MNDNLFDADKCLKSKTWFTNPRKKYDVLPNRTLVESLERALDEVDAIFGHNTPVLR